MATINKIERAHQMYREGKHDEALLFYTEALTLAKTKAQKIALHSNRAACFLKLQDFNKAAEECTSVLELDYNHTGALMLRAQTLVTLREYHSALFDVNRLLELNPSSDVYHNLQARLKTQMSLAPIPESEEEAIEAESEEEATRDERDEEAMGDELEEEATVPEPEANEKSEYESSNLHVTIAHNFKDSSDLHHKGWEAIPKPKGHSRLDYSQWDKVSGEDSSDEEDEADEPQPQYRFRVRTVGVRPVK